MPDKANAPEADRLGQGGEEPVEAGAGQPGRENRGKFSGLRDQTASRSQSSSCNDRAEASGLNQVVAEPGLKSAEMLWLIQFPTFSVLRGYHATSYGALLLAVLVNFAAGR